MIFNNPSLFQKKLLRWYKTQARDLPWRRTKDPYSIWISEIMLQQTQVQTVIPYYEKWMKRFPNVEALAKAPLADVLKHWAGLGYYRRARMLHEAAGKICADHGGEIPDTAEKLLKLPGIGRYTAGAIASIAFGQSEPILDGNVKRILSRLFAIKEPIDIPSTEKKLWAIAKRLVIHNYLSFPRKRESILNKNGSPIKAFGDDIGMFGPGDFNQAMMELGATICFPENPKCGICPVSTLCAARKLSRQKDFPVKKQKIRITQKRTAALIARKNGSVLLQKQPDRGRWGGLWTFPFWENKKLLLKAVGARHAVPLRQRMTIHHGFTRYRVRLDVFTLASLRGARKGRRGSPKSGGIHPDESRRLLADNPIEIASVASRLRNDNKVRYAWVKIKNLNNFAFPSPHQKIVKEIIEQHD